MSEEVKKTKKLSKVFEGDVLVISEGITGDVMKFDYTELSEDIQKNLMKHGLSQKLGDAAAGKEGLEATEAINKVWDGLVKGDFTIRVPAGPKVSRKAIMENLEAMGEGAEKEAAMALLRKLGLMK